jgi:hypothetical protein
MQSLATNVEKVRDLADRPAPEFGQDISREQHSRMSRRPRDVLSIYEKFLAQ